MVRPTYFDVEYSINPWMDPRKPTFSDLAVAQWERLYETYRELGHQVELVDPRPGLPDMVFAASGATVFDGKVLVARFRHTQRCPETVAFLDWFRARGYPSVRQAQWINEGEGDYVIAGSRVLGGSGYRTHTRAHAELQEYLGVPVVGLTLVDPRYYHLDTALTVLDDRTAMYYPPAFSDESRQRITELFDELITATDDDAAGFGLNAVSDGRHVVLSQLATGLIAQLREHGFEPIGADMSELHKAGGSVKCCTLEVHPGD